MRTLRALFPLLFILISISGCVRTVSSGKCDTDDQCLADESCDSGRCTPTRCEPACEPGFSCVHGECACNGAACETGTPPPPACTDDGGCAQGFSCNAGVCECGSDEACGTGMACNAGVCETATACTDDTECAGESRVCELGVCVTGCTTAADCADTLVDRWLCAAGHCMRQCIDDLWCEDGRICSQGLCEPAECQAASDCTGGGVQVCSDAAHGRCLDVVSCTSDADCGYNEGCGFPSPCPPGYDCTTGNEFCVELPSCGVDLDCADGEFCDQQHCHLPETCTVRADCATGFDCVGGDCLPFVCRGLTDCPSGEVCIQGACLAATSATNATSVKILTPGGSLASGETLQLKAVAYDNVNMPLLGATIVWSSDATPSVAVDANGLATGGTVEGVATITATFGTASDTITVRRAPNLASSNLRVRVVDMNGDPIVGARVVLGNGAEDTADAAGDTLFAPGSGPYNVHVFANGYDYVSLVGINQKNLEVPLSPASVKTVTGGGSGSIDLSGVLTEGPVELGFGGMPLDGHVSDVDLWSLMGRPYTVTWQTRRGTDSAEVASGMNITMIFNGWPWELKDTFYATGITGGRKASWSFGGRATWDAYSGASETDSDTQNLVRVLPWFANYNHGLRYVNVTAANMVVDADDVDGDQDFNELREDFGSLPNISHAPTEVPNLRTVVKTGTLPTISGTQADSVVFVLTARVPGMGRVPLGISAAIAVDDAGAPTTTVPDTLLKAVPAYQGLEVSDYQLFAVALVAANDSLSVIPSARVIDAEVLPTEVTFPDFLAAPETADWNGSARSVTFPAIAGADYQLGRIDGPDRTWRVYAPGAGGSFTLPTPPSGLGDVPTTSSARFSVLDTDGVSLDQLGSPATPNLHDADAVVTGYARVER